MRSSLQLVDCDQSLHSKIKIENIKFQYFGLPCGDQELETAGSPDTLHHPCDGRDGHTHGSERHGLQSMVKKHTVLLEGKPYSFS